VRFGYAAQEYGSEPRCKDTARQHANDLNTMVGEIDRM